MTKHFTLWREENDLLPPSIREYQQGMSTSFIVLLDISLQDDAITYIILMGLRSKDEEKIFDQVSLEVQLTILPFLDSLQRAFFESWRMDNIAVEIHTVMAQ